MRQQTNILHPDHRYVKVLARTPVSNIRLLYRSLLATKQLLLHLPQRSTRLDQIDRLNT